MTRRAFEGALTPGRAAARPEFIAGRYLRALDLATEQHYRQQRLQQHQHYLHGQGIRGGLGVVPASDPLRPWAVQVCPGYAFDCCGNEIIVPEPTVVDIWEHVWKRPLDQSSSPAYISLGYVEVPIGAIRSDPPGCGCAAEPHYQPTRLRDSFQVSVQWTLPEVGSARFAPCIQQTAPCPDCEANTAVILARVTLPAGEGNPITGEHIDPAHTH